MSDRRLTASEQIGIGKLGESLGFEWGGRWTGKKNDPGHYQMTFGQPYSELANG
jgi:hypothetical protein